MDPIKNFGIATLSAAVLVGDSSATLEAGTGANLPVGEFTVGVWNYTDFSSNTETAWFAGQMEYWRVTRADGSDTLTITQRGAEGSTPRNFNTVGKAYRVAQFITADLLNKKANVANGTHTGNTTVETLIVQKGLRIAPAPMAALAIDIKEQRNTKDLAVSSPLSLSEAPSAGDVFGAAITNVGGGSITVTIPESKSINQGALITSFTLAPGATAELSFYFDGTILHVAGDPRTIEQDRAALGLVAVASSGSASDLTSGLLPVARGGTGTGTPGLVAGSNITVSGTWPNQTIEGSGGTAVPEGAAIFWLRANAGSIPAGFVEDTTAADIEEWMWIRRGVAAPAVVTNVSSTATDGTHGLGVVVPITVTFDRSVTVTGTPQLTLETGTVNRVVNYTSGSGTAALTFNYTVQSGDTAADLDYVSTSALALNGGTINAVSNGAAATLTLPAPGAAGSLAANKALVISTSSAETAFISAFNPSGNYEVSVVDGSREAGFKFTVGGTGITVTEVGFVRASGTFANRTVKIRDNSGTLVASAVVDFTSAASGEVCWAELAAPVALSASTIYHITSSIGGYNPIRGCGSASGHTATGVATINATTNENRVATDGIFGFVNFKYTT